MLQLQKIYLIESFCCLKTLEKNIYDNTPANKFHFKILKKKTDYIILFIFLKLAETLKLSERKCVVVFL